MINKLTRRDYWAFCIGMGVVGAAMGLLARSPALFLFNALLTAYDVYMFIQTLPKDEE